MLSIVPLMRPFDAASRIAAGVVSPPDDPLQRLAVVVVERLDRRRQVVVGCRPDRAVEQPERLQPGLHLIHGRATLSVERRQRPTDVTRVNIPRHGHCGAR